jgi:hypothetical protein
MLAWDAPDDGPVPTGYGLERSYDKVNFTSVGNLGNVLAYEDAEIRAPYTCWRAFAYAIIDWQWYFSGYSNVLCIEFAAPEAMPESLSVGISGQDSEKTITLSWNATEHADGYRLYRTLGDNAGKEIASETTATEIADTQNPDLRVCRSIVAQNQFGEGKAGHEVCVTTRRDPVDVTVTIPGPDDQRPASVITIDIRPQHEKE